MSDEPPRDRGRLRDLDLRLPPLPQTLPQVLELLHAPGFVAAEDITEVIQGDPASVAQLLKHINSAYYGLRRSITNVERAVRMMGPTTAAGTVISLCMLEMNELLEGPAEPSFRALLRHSEGTALLTRHLINETTGRGDEPPDAGTGGPLGDEGFAEGLLHDFGKLVLIYNYPDKAVSLYQERVFEEYLAESDQRVLEQLIFGCDHTEAGAYAASEMNFPQVLVDVIRHHHNPEDMNGTADALETVRAVRAADLATKAMGPAFVGVRPTTLDLDWETCAKDPVWRHFVDGAANGGQEPVMALMEELRAKRTDIMLFSKFFLDADVPEPVSSTP